MSNRRWQPSPFIQASVALHVLALASVFVWPDHWRWALGAVLINQALLTGLGLWPRSRWLGANITELPATAAARNQIALTIDDGPDPEVTPQVLDILDRFEARATFFCIGDKAMRHAGLCRDIVRRGHDVQNHSQRHAHTFAFSGLVRFEREIQAAQQSLANITGRTPKLFRAPAGLRNPLLDPVLAKLGLRLVSWSCRAFDTRSSDAGAVSRRLQRGIEPGAILLMHDGHCARTADGTPVIVAVLPGVLEAATASGLQWVTLADALHCETS